MGVDGRHRGAGVLEPGVLALTGLGLVGSAGQEGGVLLTQGASLLSGWATGEKSISEADSLIMLGVWISGSSRARVPSPRGGAGHEGLGGFQGQCSCGSRGREFCRAPGAARAGLDPRPGSGPERVKGMSGPGQSRGLGSPPFLASQVSVS